VIERPRGGVARHIIVCAVGLNKYFAVKRAGRLRRSEPFRPDPAAATVWAPAPRRAWTASSCHEAPSVPWTARPRPDIRRLHSGARRRRNRPSYGIGITRTRRRSIAAGREDDRPRCRSPRHGSRPYDWGEAHSIPARIAGESRPGPRLHRRRDPCSTESSMIPAHRIWN
jgi:hypothetical protein